MVLQHGVHGGDGGIGGILCGECTSGEFNAPWGWLASVGGDEVGWGGGVMACGFLVGLFLGWVTLGRGLGAWVRGPGGVAWSVGVGLELE